MIEVKFVDDLKQVVRLGLIYHRINISARRLVFVAFFGLIFFLPTFAGAFDLASRASEFELANGLKVIVLKRSGAAQFAAHIALDVGSSDERSGYSGAAHLLEHMMFKGTRSLGSLDWGSERFFYEKTLYYGGKLDDARARSAPEPILKSYRIALESALAGERRFFRSEIYSEIYSAAGVVGFNAGTSKDFTYYIARVPANRLELWAWVESQRFKGIVYREYHKEREVIMEERQSRYENDPEGKLYEAFLATAYKKHPYGSPIIGFESDIDNMPLEEVDRFYKSFYAPNNALIVIVGNVDPVEVKRVIEKYFGDLAPKPIPARLIPVEPRQKEKRELTLDLDARASVMIGFHKPIRPDRDSYALELIESILSSSRSARLERRLVLEEKIASSVGAWIGPGEKYPNLLMIYGAPSASHSSRDLEAAIVAELDRLKSEPVPAAELERVKTGYEADLLRHLRSNYFMARLIASYQLLTGDWRDLERDIKVIRSITSEDIQRAARKYFVESNMSVARIEPIAEAD